MTLHAQESTDLRVAAVRGALAQLSRMKTDAAIVTANVLALAADQGLAPGESQECDVKAAFAALGQAVNSIHNAVNAVIATGVVALETVAAHSVKNRKETPAPALDLHPGRARGAPGGNHHI